MISTAAALAKITALFDPLAVKTVPLREAAGRTLAKNVFAARDQPPFAASAMDGYAVLQSDAVPGKTLDIIGESAAGGHFEGQVSVGQAVRIFTGAPMPKGAERVIIQEDVERVSNQITLGGDLDSASYVRPAGGDFKKGDAIKAPKRLGAADIALLASMNNGTVPVYRRPVVALIATGDELVMPGETPGPDQIIASNSFGLAALLNSAGAETQVMPIARDTETSLKTAFDLCAGVDLIVTIGGASVGDHDLVHKVAGNLGMDVSFYKVAMRPGKPLMAGRLRGIPMIGLPGNPVSSMICGHIFLLPAVQKMLGGTGAALLRERVFLEQDMPANGGREHYMRARLQTDGSRLTVTPFTRQDSALLSVLAQANVLLVRPPHDPAVKTGDMVEIIRI